MFLYPGVGSIVAHRRIRGFDHDGWIPQAWRWVFGGLEWLWVEEGNSYSTGRYEPSLLDQDRVDDRTIPNTVSRPNAAPQSNTPGP